MERNKGEKALFNYGKGVDKEEQFFRDHTILTKQNEKDIETFKKLYAFDRLNETIVNLSKLYPGIAKFSLNTISDFGNYENELSEILFIILREQENHLKGYLNKVYNNYQVPIESRTSYSSSNKLKYYFKVPVANHKTIDLRTSETKRSIDFYDMINTLDFGSINTIFMNQSPSIIKGFSSDPNIVEELDYVRRMRNYVYHHNLLYSLGKDVLKQSIFFLIKSLPFKADRELFVKRINELRYKSPNRDHDIGEEIAITFSKEEEQEICEKEND